MTKEERVKALSDEGVILASYGNYPKAIRLYLKALKIDPENTNTRIRLGYAYHRTGNNEEAVKQTISAVKRLQEINQKTVIQLLDYIEGLITLGDIAFDEGEYEQAIPPYKEAILQFNSSIEELSKTDEPYISLVNGISRFIKEATFQTAISYKKLNKFADASVWFKESLKMKPEQDLLELIYENFAINELARENYADAEKLLIKAEKNSPRKFLRDLQKLASKAKNAKGKTLDKINEEIMDCIISEMQTH